MDGKWVRETRLVYREGTPSGYRHCLVDDRQSCRRNNAHSHYLGYRWVLNDDGCEAKRITFTRRYFLSTVKNMKIAFVGDSFNKEYVPVFGMLAVRPYEQKQDGGGTHVQI